MIRIRMDGSTKRETERTVVLTERFRYLFPRLKLVTASAERHVRVGAR